MLKSMTVEATDGETTDTVEATDGETTDRPPMGGR
jgi:hypothetical protein